MSFYFPIVFMTLGTTFYHIAQKSDRLRSIRRFSLMLNYATALVGTPVLIPIYSLFRRKVVCKEWVEDHAQAERWFGGRIKCVDVDSSQNRLLDPVVTPTL